ncbi:hypothetical protein RND71_040169 [Anisodus tanguticus]|uniref:Translation initiation factor eIF2B subunit beta n=1 Tax=Anisodus tanguticus TaxID=243964 RepID=A0AAE1QY56_9SOLA|nr:hypothetical protein RND71_040169 [Anisodus tanguticus]
MPDIEGLVNDFVAKLSKRKVEGSQATSRLTAELLRSVVSLQRLPPTNPSAVLIEAVRGIGVKLIAANPVELAVGNIVRRILHIIREEDLSLLISKTSELDLAASDDEGTMYQDYDPTQSAVAAAAKSFLRSPSLHALLENMPDKAVPSNIYTSSSGGDSEEKSKADKLSMTRKLKHDVIEAINILIEDIDTCHELIAEQAVIVGVHAVMANGGVIAPVGMNMVALAAQKHAVPFVVVAGIHKLCPSYPHNPEVCLNDMRSPAELLEFGQFSNCMEFGMDSGAPLQVVNPGFDYVAPELVSLLITDM